MATPKKNTMHQVMFVLVDKTDFATMESAITASRISVVIFARQCGSSIGL